VQGYDFQTTSMLADDRCARRTDEASAERLAREIRGNAERRTKRRVGAAWSSGLIGRFRPDRLPEHARTRW
jgi:hypothetical protein